MLGGAAKGSYTRLDQDDATFEAHYIPLRNMIRERGLDGLDLDVEEPMSLGGIVRLIDRLKVDFGEAFLVTLAPVAAALMSDNPRHNLSGFSYEALEVMRGKQIAWYNAQFYCGWGDMGKTDGFHFMVTRGWPAHKIVVGLVTNPENGSGFVPFGSLQEVLSTLRQRYPTFGGVMGWEYFNSLPGDKEAPWQWALFMTKHVRTADAPSLTPPPIAQASAVAEKSNPFLDLDAGIKGEAPVPEDFAYYSDGSTGS
jgi:chitinase